MANRQSEPAPQPAPAKAEAPAAPAPAAAKMKIPNFTQDAPDAEPVSIAWNDYDTGDDGGGMPVSDGGRPGLEGTSIEGVGRPVKGKKTNVSVEGTDAEADPDIHLDANAAEGDEAEAATEGTDAEEEAPVKLTGSDRRRAALAAIEREQQTRAIETNLIAERSRREELEKKLKSASLGELLALRGINRDDALESLIAGKEGKSAEELLTPEQKREAQRDADIEALKKDRDTEKAKNTRLEYQAQLGAVAAEANKHAAVPVVHAALKSGMVVDHDEQGQPLTAAQWINGLAVAEWTKAGSPPGKQKAYVKAAAEVLEDKLVEDHGPIGAAIAAKKGGQRQETRETPATARPPSLRRPAARPGARPTPLPRDRDALDVEIKRRFNLR